MEHAGAVQEVGDLCQLEQVAEALRLGPALWPWAMQHLRTGQASRSMHDEAARRLHRAEMRTCSSRQACSGLVCGTLTTSGSAGADALPAGLLSSVGSIALASTVERCSR